MFRVSIIDISKRLMLSFLTSWGVARSLMMYYAIPGRYGRMRRFYQEFIQPGDLCFDIGAHVGNRIRVWLGLGARVVAVEPQPMMMRWLHLLYSRHPRVTLLPVAVGATAGSATLQISSRTPTVSTLSPDWIAAVRQDKSFAWVEWDQALTVPVVTLDDLISAHGRPAFCKIDIEGYEGEALRGLSQPLAGLSFEHIITTAAQTEECLQLLAALGEYEFNYSTGESHRLHFARWLPAAEMAARVGGLDGSGDVYGRLRPNFPTAG
jgi:FkbM family methyltransferase